MQQMPQQMAMQQAMPQGMPSQMGLGALAAQRQQGGQADPRLMAMMQALGGNRPQPAMPMGPRVDQFGRPSATGQFAFDAGQQQRIAQTGLTPDQLAQMTPDQMARFQPMAPVDIDPSTGRPIDAQKQSQIMAQQAFANQAMQGNPGMGAPGGAQFSAMNFTPRPATMGLDGMPIQRANDPQMLAQMQAFQRQGGQGGMPGGMPMPKMPGMIDSGGMPGGVPVQLPMPFDPRRPVPVGAGGKGTGMPPPGMVNPPRPMPLPPGLNRPMPMPMPPGVNRPMPMPMPKPAPKPVRPTPKPVNPRFNQIMPFLR
jgi:hypothetical protein